MPAMTFGEMYQVISQELQHLAARPADAGSQLLADALEACLTLAAQTDRLKQINADLRHRLRAVERLSGAEGQILDSSSVFIFPTL